MQKLLSRFFKILFMTFLICCEKYENVIITDVENLCDEFKINKEAAIGKYKGKTIQITGVIFSINYPKDALPIFDASYIVFGNELIDGEFVILASFDAVTNTDNLKEGEQITIYGKFDTITNTSIELRHCKIGEVSTNSKICRGPNIFGVVHSKSGKDWRNFVQENEKCFWKQTIYKVYGHSFPLDGWLRENVLFIRGSYAVL
jgi:hypothetical protein